MAGYAKVASLQPISAGADCHSIHRSESRQSDALLSYGCVKGSFSRLAGPRQRPCKGPVARLVGIEGGVVSGEINLESSGVEASDLETTP